MRQPLLVLAAALPLAAQTALSLEEGVRIALENHPALQQTASRTRAAESRVTQARGGYLPKATYTESFTRSDNPVFVFSSLLTQRQFTEGNFRIGPLNRPDFLNNFQSLVSVEQTVFDWGATRAHVRSAELGREVSVEQERRTRMQVIAGVVSRYYGAVLAQASLDVAREALKSAESDAERAESIRQAGMSTDADVLAIRVHLASVRQQEIQRTYDVQVALAALNEALGLPLETPHALTTQLSPAKTLVDAIALYESSAAQSRPELKQAQLASRMAEHQTSVARSALLPQFGVRGAFETDRQQFVNRGGANWLFSASLRWNVFDGNANRARVSEARAMLDSARAQQRQAEAGVKLEIRRAWADAKAAEERLAVAAASVTHAEESLRIIKDRYANGFTTVTELLRSETALLDTRTRRLAAIHDHRVAAAQLELASGTLSIDSEVLK